MGEEEVATKKGRRLIACSGLFRQKLLRSPQPFLMVYEHAGQCTLSETREALDCQLLWQQFNKKLLGIWAWFMYMQDCVLIIVK